MTNGGERQDDARLERKSLRQMVAEMPVSISERSVRRTPVFGGRP